MSKTKEYIAEKDEAKLKELSADLSWEHGQHFKEFEPNCSECHREYGEISDFLATNFENDALGKRTSSEMREDSLINPNPLE